MSHGAAVAVRARPPRGWRARFAPARRAWLALALLPAAACVDERQEVQIGARVASQVNAQVPLVHDAPLNAYVSALGISIARRSARPSLDYHFYIVDTDAVNAFALPGGYVYVNRGLIERTRTQSELAAVLAHEIGHVAARHGARNLQRQMRTGSLVSVLYRVILGREPEILNQDALNLGGALWTAANSRADEQEADRLAVGYLIRDGVDPRGMVTLLDRLLDEERRNPAARNIAWFASHPTTQSRIDHAQAEIGRDLPDPASRHLSRDVASYAGFLRRLDALPPPPLTIPLGR
ncbi:MAG TPA: M48 family metallopeptidase [Longimicrobiaceae bacterium]|nr:M48 family metallopeptidase [Longimicrobiaceae bacterium]